MVSTQAREGLCVHKAPGQMYKRAARRLPSLGPVDIGSCPTSTVRRFSFNQGWSVFLCACAAPGGVGGCSGRVASTLTELQRTHGELEAIARQCATRSGRNATAFLSCLRSHETDGESNPESGCLSAARPATMSPRSLTAPDATSDAGSCPPCFRPPVARRDVPTIGVGRRPLVSSQPARQLMS